MLVDLHIHGMAHGNFNHTPEQLLPFIQAAEKKGIDVVGFAEHIWYLEEINFAVLKQMAGMNPRMDIRVGLEIDHRPGDHGEIRNSICPYSFDYLIGSVHEIEGWMFDHPDYVANFDLWDIDRLYEKYFFLVEDLVRSGIYDIIGHFDLIKINGHRPSKKIEEFVFPILELAAKKDIVVEVNTSGIYKPVNEIYPSLKILKICKDLRVPVTLGSDAHLPDHVGRDIALAAKILMQLGIKEVVSFKGRKPILHSLF